MRSVLALTLTLILTPPVMAQALARPDTTIDAATRAQVIENVLRRLDEGYVFPQKAAEMARAVRARAKRGAYDQIVRAQAFADTLTRDLRAVSHDRHLEVAYQKRSVRDEVPDAEPSAEERREREAFGRRINYGQERVER
jgi:hypothetical protein